MSADDDADADIPVYGFEGMLFGHVWLVTEDEHTHWRYRTPDGYESPFHCATEVDARERLFIIAQLKGEA